MKNKEFDMIVYGATSFVGQILCRYLVNEYTEPNFTWVMAARSESKLTELKSSLGAAAESIPTIVADSFDEAAMQGLCERAEVIISTVGPYALYGELLVKACAESGTDYCDLTGESQWIRRMIAAYQDTAKESGARIVHCCGFDSIPSDLGVKFLQEQALEKFGNPCSEVKMGVKAMQGGASGGTVASAINLYKEAAKDPALREELKDLYSLCPPGHGNEARQHNVSKAEYIEEFNSWAGPFIMAGINVRIVLRSNALLGGGYGLPFKYFEASLTGDGAAGEKRAKRLARGMGLIGLVMVLPPLRWLATTFFLPKPGEGPTPEQQQKGFFDIRIHGRTENDDQIKVKVTGDRDPGYGSTAKMLAQAAISLHRDVDKGDKGGGIWTPAAIFGEDLYRRLQSYAGLSFEVLDVIPGAKDSVEPQSES
ncbi:MAG: saccharopine dehydrogenase NADP-binding domain-containing protein [Pseudomonadales bacterium]|nr:saccharopine dehydrogenase NADP-binding domain-containing protein [Pseudomonadales bacterium]